MGFNNNLILQYGRVSASNNRTFHYPISFSTKAFPLVCSECPVTFDSYKCVTYIWSDSTLSSAHVITTSQNTPGAFIIAIGF